MTKHFIIVIIHFFIFNSIYAQDSLTVKPKKYKTLRYFTYGLGAYGGCDKKCEMEVCKKYSFVTKEKGGCNINRRQKKRWEKHNKKVIEEQEARYGTGWWGKYVTEINQCCKK